MQEKKEFNQIEYMNKYNKENYKRYSILLNKSKDKELINLIEKQKNKSEFLKEQLKKSLKK